MPSWEHGDPSPASHRRAVVQALFVVFLWATSWVLIKTGLEEIPALTFAGLRYSLAFVCLAPVLAVSGLHAPLRGLGARTWWRLILLGLLLYAITQGASFVALSLLPAVTVNLLWSFSSVAVAVLSGVWLGERPTIIQWLGVGLTVAGAGLFLYPVSLPRSQWVGVLVAAGGVLANALASLIGREFGREGRLPPLTVTVVTMGVGSVVLIGSGLAWQGLPALSLRSWAIVAWLAVVNTAFAFTLWNHTLRTVTATESTVINGTMLIWIPVLAVLFLGETISTREAIGLAIVGLGTVLVQLRRTAVGS
jgi:drug/metabolite transporter (DMT)-like permease